MTANLKRVLASVFVGLALMSIAPTAHASCNSGTTVIVVMENSTVCGGKGSYQTAASGGYMICAATDLQMRVAMAAYLSGRPVMYQLGGGDTDCNPDGNYNSAKAPTWLQMN